MKSGKQSYYCALINAVGFPNMDMTVTIFTNIRRIQVRRTVAKGVFLPENYGVFPVVFNNMVCYNWI